MTYMAGRKRYSAEDIVRNLRRCERVGCRRQDWRGDRRRARFSPATLYNWCRTCGSMDTHAAGELKELRDQSAGLKRLLAEAELEKHALRWPVTGLRR